MNRVTIQEFVPENVNIIHCKALDENIANICYLEDIKLQDFRTAPQPLVSLAAVLRLITQRPLRDKTQNGCKGDYTAPYILNYV